MTARPRGRRRLGAAVGAALLVAGCVAPGDDLPTLAGSSAAPPTSVPPPVATVGDGDAPADTGTGDAVAGTAAAAGVDRLFVRVEFDTLTGDQLAAMRAVDGVTSVVSLRTSDLALFGSSRRDGTPVDDLPADFKVSLAGVVDDAEVGLGLGPGEVAMTTTGLAFRDLDVGGRVELAAGVTATVAVIADDEALASTEIVVAEVDAAALDVRPRQRASVHLAPEAVVADVVAAVEEVVAANGIVQPREIGAGALVMSLPRTKRLFGEFAFKDLPGRDVQQGASFVREHITRRDVPFFGTITCHEAIFDPLVAALQQIRDEGLGDEVDPSLYGGCWTPRRINRNANLSRHAWGIAIDVNVDFSEPGGGPIPSEGVIRAFEDHGFVWGGDYPIPDNHHFEYHGDR